MIRWEYEHYENDEFWVYQENDSGFLFHTWDIKQSIHKRMDIRFKLKYENSKENIETILKETEAL